jgi:hypothetical protein
MTSCRSNRTILEICTFQFRTFQFSISLCPSLSALCSSHFVPRPPAQTVADKAVATVTNGARANPDLITYSDLVWQLTLEPSPVFDPRPGSADLNRALKTLEDQLLILQEARKLPWPKLPKPKKNLKTRSSSGGMNWRKLLVRVRSKSAWPRVGLTSEQLNAILRDRVTIDRYLDFRFRAFVLVSAQEISDRYEKTYRPQRNRGVLVPTLEQARDRIETETHRRKDRRTNRQVSLMTCASSRELRSLF